MDIHLLVTCEHGGNRIPAAYRHLFVGAGELLHSHRGYDPGALRLARDLADALEADFVGAVVSRLLVDLNRSPGHPRLHGEAVRGAPPTLRREIVECCYLPHRERVEAIVRAALERGERVIHIASHSFTPELDGVVRNADIGLLYDPARRGEVELCRYWAAALGELLPRFKVRRNYPYRGVSDGLCAWLRRRYPADRYVGVELEINHKHVRAGGAPWMDLRQGVVEALELALRRDVEAAEPVSRSA